MKKYFITILSFFAIFQMASCRPSDLTPDDITRDTKIDLPGSERINKRAVEDSTYGDIQDDDDDDYSAEYDPTDGGSSDKAEALESREDFDLAESSIVFHPLFVSRQRSLVKNRISRSTDEDLKNEKLEPAENGMVFLPLFRSQNRIVEKQRLYRSVDNVSKTKAKDVIETDANLGDDDVIYKSTLKRIPRPIRSVPEIAMLRNGDELIDDMAFAENGLIFRPLFRSRQRDAGSA